MNSGVLVDGSGAAGGVPRAGSRAIIIGSVGLTRRVLPVRSGLDGRRGWI